MRTIQFEVAYKTEPDMPRHTQLFNTEAAAVAFMYHIETTGGISVMQRVVKDEPIPKPFNPGDDYEF